MKRLWYVDIQTSEEALVVRAANVFDGCEAEEPVEAQVSKLADVEAILSALKPFARRNYRSLIPPCAARHAGALTGLGSQAEVSS